VLGRTRGNSPAWPRTTDTRTTENVIETAPGAVSAAESGAVDAAATMRGTLAEFPVRTGNDPALRLLAGAAGLCEEPDFETCWRRYRSRAVAAVESRMREIKSISCPSCSILGHLEASFRKDPNTPEKSEPPRFPLRSANMPRVM
jgi:hypothetical protein